MMIARRFAPLAAMAFAFVVGLAADAQADDHHRKLGIGFSAGYHAPVACPAPSYHQKLGVWHGWKTACTLPNVRQLGGDCDCAPCAAAQPCAPAMPCFPAAPCGCGCEPAAALAPAGFGRCLFPSLGGCSTCSGPVVQPSRAALMFN